MPGITIVPDISIIVFRPDRNPKIFRLLSSYLLSCVCSLHDPALKSVGDTLIIFLKVLLK